MEDTLTKEEMRDAVRQAVREVYLDPAIVSPETHEDHHRWLQEAIRKQQRCIDNRHRITNHILGWIAVAALSGILTMLFIGYQAYHRQLTGG